MAYFANGTEGDMYEEKYCSRCVHNQDEERGCPVMNAHLMYNYGQTGVVESVLSMLIPRDGIRNEQCRMFVELTVEDTSNADS